MPSGYKKDGTPRALGKNNNFYIIKSLIRWRNFSGDTASYISKTIDARKWTRLLIYCPSVPPTSAIWLSERSRNESGKFGQF